MKGNKKPFEIPQATLTQLAEFSTGFVLFVFDEYGQPQIYSALDSTIAATAMKSFIKDWSIALENISIENLTTELTKKPRKRD